MLAMATVTAFESADKFVFVVAELEVKFEFVVAKLVVQFEFVVATLVVKSTIALDDAM